MAKKFFKRFGKYAFKTKKGASGKMKMPNLYKTGKMLSSRDKYGEEFYQFAIIDPGCKSCGVRIERYYLQSLKKKLIWYSIISFGSSTEEINENMSESFVLISPFLEECHHILVEHQEMFGQVNYQYFSSMIFYITNNICNKGFRPYLYDIDVRLKTTYLGGPTTSRQNNGESIKKWTKEKAKKFCIEDKDSVSFNILNNSMAKAVEDLSDLKCYCRAWPMYLSETEEIPIHFDRNLLVNFI